MLKNVKSKFIIKVIFLYIDECSKLKLVKHNKNFQKIININIINYKYFSRRYIEYGQNGKGKEYNFFGILEFEGDYKNGQRNGNGTEYNLNATIRFKGEYLNGKRHGEGKEYYCSEHCNYCNGTLKYKGEYKNGKRNGKGKEYYRECYLKFDGEFLNDKELIGTRYDNYERKKYIFDNIF